MRKRRNPRIATMLLCTLAAGASTARAQQDDPDTLRITSRVVNVEVLVTDKRTGARVDGLKRENFRIMDDGRPVEIKHFSQGSEPAQPLALLLLINVRGTTKATVPRLRAALASALSHLRPDDEVAVFDYWLGHEMVQGLTRDRAKVFDALSVAASRQEDSSRPRPKGYGRKSGVGEDLAAALLEAMRHTRERLPNARVSFVVIDDDLNATSSKIVNQTADQLLERGATVSGLIKVSGEFATTLKSITRAINKSHYPTLNSRDNENVAFYSQRTGGEVVNIKDDEFGEALERVVGNLAARYSLGFEPDASRLDNRFHKLKVSVDVPKTLGKVGKLEVRVRRGYFARKTVEDVDKTQR